MRPVRPAEGRALELSQGRYFLAVCETRNVTRAANSLYRPYEVVTDAGSQGKPVDERRRPGSARSAVQAAQAASTTAS